MAMTQKFIKGLLTPAKGADGFDLDGVVDDIFTASKQQLDDLRTKKDGEIATLKTRISDIEHERDALLNDDSGDGFEQKLKDEVAAHAATKIALERDRDDEKAAHEATRARYQDEKDGILIDSLFSDALKAHKDDKGRSISPAVIPDILDSRSYDRAVFKLERDNDNRIVAIKNIEDVLPKFAERYERYYGTTQTKGANTGDPSGSGGSGGATKNPWLKENRSLAEQTRIAREDPQLAMQMAAAAGIPLKL